MDYQEEKKELHNFLDFSQAKKSAIIGSLVNTDIYYESIDVSDDVFKDTDINRWSASVPCLDGTKELLRNLTHKPINDSNVLRRRQDCYRGIECDISVLKDYEDDVLWIYTLNDEIKHNNLIHALFPSAFIVSYINHVECALNLFHVYKLYINPLSTLLYPLVTLLAPLYYLRTLKFNMSLSMYISLISKMVRMLFTYSGNIKQTLMKIVSVGFYAFLFAYNIYQTFEYSYMLHQIRSTLYDRVRNFNTFVSHALRIFEDLPDDIASPFIKIGPTSNVILADNMSFVYRLWKDKELKKSISCILLKMYAIDVVCSVARLKESGWCDVDYSGTTKMWHMKNPLLRIDQVANPVDLSKNIIITGPNAAGKTTYVKTALLNILLSQSLGVAYAIRAEVEIYDNISSFMRITDVLGSKSYFEAEAEYCNRMMNKSKLLSESNRRGLFIMDEPMHSTPPTEGMATAFAVAEYIGGLPGITLIVTTHFYMLTNLEEAYGDRYLNLSVEAIKGPDRFHFPYTIKRGPSNQCIAIELLDSKEFPRSVIDSAVIMKNKICNGSNR